MATLPLRVGPQISEYKAAVRASWSKVETTGDAANQVFHKRLAEQDAAVAELFKGAFLIGSQSLIACPGRVRHHLNCTISCSRPNHTHTPNHYSRLFRRLCESPRSSPDSKQTEAGGTPFFELIRMTIKKIDDFDSLVPALQAAGRVQRKVGVRTKHFDAVGSSFLYALENALSKSSGGESSWTKPVKEAWMWVFVFIAKVMQPPDDDETRKKAAVRRTWAVIESKHAPFAELLFKTLVESDAQIAAMFKGA